jgi:hypothetical protein
MAVGRSTIASATLKMPVVSPIPKAMDRTDNAAARESFHQMAKCREKIVPVSNRRVKGPIISPNARLRTKIIGPGCTRIRRLLLL